MCTQRARSFWKSVLAGSCVLLGSEEYSNCIVLSQNLSHPNADFVELNKLPRTLNHQLFFSFLRFLNWRVSPRWRLQRWFQSTSIWLWRHCLQSWPCSTIYSFLQSPFCCWIHWSIDTRKSTSARTNATIRSYGYCFCLKTESDWLIFPFWWPRRCRSSSSWKMMTKF